MKNCSACGGSARKLQRAIILKTPGGARPGLVCRGCARLGWLLVFGEDKAKPDTPKTVARKARAAAAAAKTAAFWLGEGDP
jgi:hypothetical protein